MVTPSNRQQSEKTQNDPGVSNDPKSSLGDYNAHAWHSLNQIFERLGKMDQKIDQLAIDQGKLKESVEKHDKIIARVGFTIAGAVIVVTALWFLYENLLKGHIFLK